MIARRVLLSSLLPTALLVSCNQGGGGGGDPDVRPNDAPIVQVPGGLSGSLPQLRFLLAISGAETLRFAATDPDGDPLQWQVSVAGGAAAIAAAGVIFATPVAGNEVTLEFTPVAQAVAVAMNLTVEDPYSGVASFDLLVVRTGPPTITGVSPDTAFEDQPQRVTVTGTALSLGGLVSPQVTFDGRPGTDVDVRSDTIIECDTPSSQQNGPSGVRVTHQYGSASLPSGAFTMFDYPPVFDPTDERLDAGTASSLDLALQGAEMHAVFVDNGALVHRGSQNGGGTWSAAQPLSGLEVASEARVAVAGVNVIAAWIGDGNSVWVCRSGDGGASFTPAQPIGGGAAPCTRPRICADADACHVAWVQGESSVGMARIHAAASSDGGVSWTTAVPIEDGGANQTDHAVACAGSAAWVVCTDDRLGAPVRGIYAVRTSDTGTTWAPAQRLSRADTASSRPCLSIEGSRVHVCWQRDGSLIYNLSINGGANWRTSVILVRDDEAGAISAPDICAENGRVFAIYTAGGDSVWVSRFDAIAQPVHVQVDSAGVAAALPRIACQGRYVLVAWRSGALGGAARIVQTLSVDTGQTFLGPSGLGDGIADQDAPVLRNDGARLLLGWLDSRAASTGAFVNSSIQ